MEKIKIVIWDLDDTFWSGTLSEGNIEIIPHNIDIVRTLTDRGIINSIVSKNEYLDAKAKLENINIFDLFVMPQISWNPKGQIIANLLKTLRLRPVNCLFIDDNPSNLNEAVYYNEGLNVADPSILKSLLDMPQLKGKDDSDHFRLKQYKELEIRCNEEKKYSSNIEFLMDSQIKLSINDDCLANLVRIEELVERTNQLNFTKNRMDETLLSELLSNARYESRYIVAEDRFGEYGIVGYYCLDKENNVLVHFLFSCRVLGLGIEKYIYQKLNYPQIDIVGDVASALTDHTKVSWIQETQLQVNEKQIEASEGKKILFIGGCDLEQSAYYLKSKFPITTEFATVENGYEIRRSDLINFINMEEVDEADKRRLANNIPFIDYEKTYNSKIYSKEYEVLVLSVVDDYIRGVYCDNTEQIYLTVGDYLIPDRWKTGYKSKDLLYFENEFQYRGKETTDFFRANLEKVISKAARTKQLIIIINGNEVDVSDWDNVGPELIQQYREFNVVVDEVIAKYNNVQLLDMRKIVREKKQLPKHDNRHYSRDVYYLMAEKLADLIDNKNIVLEDLKKESFVSNIKYIVKRIMKRG